MKHSPKDFTPAEQVAALNYLLSDRCLNYGYDWKAFRLISNQRSRARRAIRKNYIGIPSALHWGALSDRLQAETLADGTIRVEYVVGQSSNEEITNVLRRLVDPEARWVS
jgi:hypothetical protein